MSKGKLFIIETIRCRFCDNQTTMFIRDGDNEYPICTSCYANAGFVPAAGFTLRLVAPLEETEPPAGTVE